MSLLSLVRFELNAYHHLQGGSTVIQNRKLRVTSFKILDMRFSQMMDFGFLHRIMSFFTFRGTLLPPSSGYLNLLQVNDEVFYSYYAV